MRARMLIDRDFVVGPVSPRLNSAHFEHAGRYVYNGIYEPGHPRADADGMRMDVMELVKEMGTRGLRYPGGNFSSGYRWKDGIGPREGRPARPDLAWRSLEPNTVGTDEIMAWAAKVGCEPMITLNIGVGGVSDACDWLEYLNFPSGTYYSDLRAKNRHPQPYGVKTWFLGNELDGEWQIGHMTAGEYALKAAQVAQAMRMMTPEIELILIGASSPQMESYPDFMKTALLTAYDLVDMVSIHRYYGGDQGWDTHGTEDFLGVSLDMENYIRESVSVCDYAKAACRSRKKMRLSFDEFAIWPDIPYERMHMETAAPWYRAGAPLAEGDVSFRRFLVSCLCGLAVLRHADRIDLFSNLLTNICGPIRTEIGGPAWRQPTFFLMKQIGLLAGGNVLEAHIDCPKYDSYTFTDVPYLDAVAVHFQDEGRLVVLAVNRSLREPVNLDVSLSGFGKCSVTSHLVMESEDIHRTNGPQGEPLSPRRVNRSVVTEGICQAELSRFSWNVIELKTEREEEL